MENRKLTKEEKQQKVRKNKKSKEISQSDLEALKLHFQG